MSLTYSERKILADIQVALRGETPRLAARFALFNRLNAAEPPPPAHEHGGRWHRIRPVALLVIVVTVLVVTLMIYGLATGNYGSCEKGAATAACAPPASGK